MEWPSGSVLPEGIEFAAPVPVMGAPPRLAASAAAAEVVPAGPLVTTRLVLASNCEHRKRICAANTSFTVSLARRVVVVRDVLFVRDLPSLLPPSAIVAPIALPAAARAPVALPVPETLLFVTPAAPALLLA